MRKRFMLSALLLMCVLLFSACGKMSDEEAIAAMRESDELWITHGLAAWEAGTEAENIASLFEDGKTIWYLYLHNYMFIYDEENSKLAAEQFFRYVAEKHGLAAVLDTDKRVAYKTEYLRSLGFDFDYPKSAEEETFFRNITFHSDDRYDYIFTNKNASFCLKKLEPMLPLETQTMIYETMVFRDKFEKKLKKEGLTAYFDTDRRIVFYCENIGVSTAASSSNKTGVVRLTSILTPPHESVHAMANFDFSDGASFVFCEGIAEYFSKACGINKIYRRQFHGILANAEAGNYDRAAEQGDIRAKSYIELLALYKANGGKFESIEDIDETLLAHCKVLSDRRAGQNISIYETRLSINPNTERFVGDVLTYEEVTSMTVWIVEQYGLDAMLEAWRTENFLDTLGKDFETLQSEWEVYLTQYDKLPEA